MILLALVAEVDCDVFNELLTSVKILHDKVDQISMEQIRTNEKVDQLQTGVENKISKIEEKIDKANEAIIQKLMKIIDLDNLKEANNKTFNQLKSDINGLGLEMSSKLENCCTENFADISSSMEDVDKYIHNADDKNEKANEKNLQKTSEVPN